MPTYEYACQQCGHQFEQFQSITAKPLKKCPECGKNSLQRLIGTGAGILFKGSGFYATDYRSESYQQGKKAEESTTGGKSKEGGESSGAKTESSAANKSDSKESTPPVTQPASKDNPTDKQSRKKTH
jgi:putative FmdB family regulatory protein